MRTLVLVAAVTTLGLLAAPAAAHQNHSPLPEGFRAEATGITDARGTPVALDDVAFRVAADGVGLTVTNRTATVLEITGEQAGEPVVQVTATSAVVNEVSPQAAGVEGATVDPAAAAPLTDLVRGQVPPRWLSLPTAGEVTLMDHRAAMEAPVRSEYDTGDVVGDWKVAFTYGGRPHLLMGRVVAVPVAGQGGVGWWLWAVVAVLAAGVAALLLTRRAPSAAAPAEDDSDVLVDAGRR